VRDVEVVPAVTSWRPILQAEGRSFQLGGERRGKNARSPRLQCSGRAGSSSGFPSHCSAQALTSNCIPMRESHNKSSLALMLQSWRPQWMQGSPRSPEPGKRRRLLFPYTPQPP